MRLVALILAIFIVLGAGFLLLGGHRLFDPNTVQEALNRYRAWALPAGFLLMLADLVLPVPSSAIMNWYGNAYHTLLGGLAGTAVCVAASAAAYWLCRWFGRPVALRIAGERDLDRAKKFFSRWGSVAVAAARPVPMLAEAIYCLAGMSGMPFGRFLAASTVGSAAFAFFFAWLGDVGRSQEEPLAFMALSVLIPAAAWVPVAIWLQVRRRFPD